MTKTPSDDLPPTVTQQIVTQTYSGPLPSAVEAERYEQLYPGSVKLLFEMAERQIANTHERNMGIIDSSNKQIDSNNLDIRKKYSVAMWSMAGVFCFARHPSPAAHGLFI